MAQHRQHSADNGAGAKVGRARHGGQRGDHGGGLWCVVKQRPLRGSSEDRLRAAIGGRDQRAQVPVASGVVAHDHNDIERADIGGKDIGNDHRHLERAGEITERTRCGCGDRVRSQHDHAARLQACQRRQRLCRLADRADLGAFVRDIEKEGLFPGNSAHTARAYARYLRRG